MSAIVSVKLKDVVTQEGRIERVPDLGQIGLPVPEEAVQVIYVTPEEAVVKVDLIPLLIQILQRIEKLESSSKLLPP